jgi:phosphatidylglycerophosphate synthase
MFLINIANPLILLLALFITICLIYIGKEAKNAYIPLMALIVFLILLVMHGIQFLVLPAQYEDMAPVLGKCLAVDFVLIFISYISYLWVDDIETKEKKKKSIDNSLDWFWKNV